MLKKLITISITAIASLQAATTYNKSLSDGNSDLNYWSDTTSSNLTNHTLVGATEVFTIGSRKNIPNVPTPIKVSTNKLCSDDRKGLVSCSKSDSLEPRYTDDGLATSGESNLRTWYKAATPKSVNGVVDDPCPSLSNVGSVVNWWTDFPSLRCERTITTYTPKVDSTVYENKIATTTTSAGTTVYANKISGSSSYAASTVNEFICGISSFGSGTQLIFQETPKCSNYPFGAVKIKTPEWKPIGVLLCPDGQVCGTILQKGILSCPSGGTLSGSTCITTTSTCPSGYVDNVSNCKKTISGTTTTTYSCPATYTDNVSNCKKTVKVCPDTSWTDNGTNCKKNVPEYKLFSTF